VVLRARAGYGSWIGSNQTAHRQIQLQGHFGSRNSYPRLSRAVATLLLLLLLLLLLQRSVLPTVL
jgi:hypothetical protein